MGPGLLGPAYEVCLKIQFTNRHTLMMFVAGIPTVIRPFFGDQFFWADRVEALGVGTGVRKLTTSALSDALVSATTDAKQIARAKLIGEQIRGVRTAQLQRM